jgi:hypothetical protein
MFAQHRQNRSRIVLAAAIGSGLFWSGVGLPLSLQAQGPDPATQLKVSYITAGWVRTTNPTQKKGIARVDIVDGNGTPINGALVVGNWSGCFKLNNVSDTTETVCSIPGFDPMPCVDGRAVIWGKTHSCRGKNCLFTFAITSVEKDGMTYVPVAGMTSGGLWCNVLGATVQRGTKATLASDQHVVTRTQPIPTRRLARWWRR